MTVDCVDCVDDGVSDLSLPWLGVAVDPESEVYWSSRTLDGSCVARLVFVCWGFI